MYRWILINHFNSLFRAIDETAEKIIIQVVSNQPNLSSLSVSDCISREDWAAVVRPLFDQYICVARCGLRSFTICATTPEKGIGPDHGLDSGIVLAADAAAPARGPAVRYEWESECQRAFRDRRCPVETGQEVEVVGVAAIRRGKREIVSEPSGEG
jgi:hypothetical protein